jgi:electron transport complex protein RnfB
MPHDHTPDPAAGEKPADALPDQYRRLAEALDRLANGFPRTGSGIELLVLRKIFSPEEAGLACLLGERAESFVEIALRAGAPVPETRQKLFSMAKKGMVWPAKVGERLGFRLAPFVVGISSRTTWPKAAPGRSWG